MSVPDELRHYSGGEGIDRAAQDAIRLAHRALARFPQVVQRHKFIAGGAAVSSALVVLAGVAIARRMRRGATADEAVEALTEQELGGQRPEGAAEDQRQEAGRPDAAVAAVSGAAATAAGRAARGGAGAHPNLSAVESAVESAVAGGAEAASAPRVRELRPLR